jgi:hypothetical protein
VIPLLEDSGLAIVQAAPENGEWIITIRTLDGRTLNEEPVRIHDLRAYERADEAASGQRTAAASSKEQARDAVAFAKMEFMNAQMAFPVDLGEPTLDAFELSWGSLKNVQDLARFEAKAMWRVAWANQFRAQLQDPRFDVYLSGAEALSAEQREIVENIFRNVQPKGVHNKAVPESKTLVGRALDQDTYRQRVRDNAIDRKSVHLSVADADDQSLESVAWLLQYGVSLGQVLAKHAKDGVIDYEAAKKDADLLADRYVDPINRRLTGEKIDAHNVAPFLALLSGQDANLFSRFVLSLMSIQKIDFSGLLAAARMAVSSVGKAA